MGIPDRRTSNSSFRGPYERLYRRHPWIDSRILEISTTIVLELVITKGQKNPASTCRIAKSPSTSRISGPTVKSRGESAETGISRDTMTSRQQGYNRSSSEMRALNFRSNNVSEPASATAVNVDLYCLRVSACHQPARVTLVGRRTPNTPPIRRRRDVGALQARKRWRFSARKQEHREGETKSASMVQAQESLLPGPLSGSELRQPSPSTLSLPRNLASEAISLIEAPPQMQMTQQRILAVAYRAFQRSIPASWRTVRCLPRVADKHDFTDSPQLRTNPCASVRTAMWARGGQQRDGPAHRWRSFEPLSAGPSDMRHTVDASAFNCWRAGIQKTRTSPFCNASSGFCPRSATVLTQNSSAIVAFQNSYTGSP